MNKLNLGLAASLLALGIAGCDRGSDGGGTGATGNTASSTPMVTTAPNGDWTRLVNATAEGGMLLGNPNAKVKVVEFASMTCSFCANFATQDKPRLVDQHLKSGNVSFEFRNYVRDPLDITASLIARCAGATPQFFALTDGMFVDQKSFFDRIGAVPQDQLAALQQLPPAQQFQRMAQLSGLQEWAAQRGLPSAKSGQCLGNQAEIDRLVQMVSDATSQYDITGTPTFLVNGEVKSLAAGTPTYDQLEGWIKEAL
jgi:protein-disulfide isomerase